MSPAPLLRVTGLTKRFGARVAVEDCSLDIAEGSIRNRRSLPKT